MTDLVALAGAGSAQSELHRAALHAARQAIIAMRANDEIGDDAVHRIEAELDWLDMRPSKPAIASGDRVLTPRPGGRPGAGHFSCLIPGGSTGAGHFLLRGQKKVTQEKAAPVSRHYVVALCCSTRPAAVELALIMKDTLNERALRQVLAEFPTLPATARRLTRGPKGEQRRELMLVYGCSANVRASLKFKIRNHATARIATLLAYRPLCEPPSNTGGPGVFGEDLFELSRVQSVFSQIESEFHSRPARRVTQGTLRRGSPGAVFLCLLSLTAQRK